MQLSDPDTVQQVLNKSEIFMQLYHIKEGLIHIFNIILLPKRLLVCKMLIFVCFFFQLATFARRFSDNSIYFYQFINYEMSLLE